MSKIVSINQSQKTNEKGKKELDASKLSCLTQLHQSHSNVSMLKKGRPAFFLNINPMNHFQMNPSLLRSLLVK